MGRSRELLLIGWALISTAACGENSVSNGSDLGASGDQSGTAGSEGGNAGTGTAGAGAAGQTTAGSAGQATAGSAGQIAEAGSDVATVMPCTLKDSGPVVASQDGQVIEGLRIVAAGMPAIRVDGHSKVTIRNVDIHHSGAPGISFSNADDIVIENVSVEHTGAPASGANPSADRVNIVGTSSERVHIHGARLRRGSSGIYLTASPDSLLQFIEGYDFRGPFHEVSSCNGTLRTTGCSRIFR